VQLLGEPGDRSPEVARALLSAVREALASVARHAEALAVRLTLCATPEG